MDFVEMMRLRGQAAENIYFAQRDRELIDELHAHPEKLQKSAADPSDNEHSDSNSNQAR
ncbi:hypothetical protein F7U70_000571 [Vibrio fluvialis]|uniref:hypothetical protein n=1 Tax=Vibrio fluvialis TaxID=676 RepID=UPI0023A9DBE6|nr:hypothetical protein [Vibrio fluvialis]EKO3941734.1 hypothetical protein [Vibrio fluvialis]MDE5179536.1 hypothetical protein [Vibrio fluvialis]